MTAIASAAQTKAKTKAAAKATEPVEHAPKRTSKEVGKDVIVTTANSAPTVGSDTKTIAERHGFKVGETVVYSKHGVGKIIGIKEKHVVGTTIEMFIITSAGNKLTMMLPTARAEALGLRKLSSATVITQALETLSGRTRVKRMMWSRRAQEYETDIKSGDLVTIAKVARDLYRSDAQTEASYSERQICEVALDRMTLEIASINGISELEARALIEAHLQKGPGRCNSAPSTISDNDDVSELV